MKVAIVALSVVTVVALGGVWVERGKRHDAQMQLSELKLSHSQSETLRESEARAYESAVARLRDEHSQTQQKLTDEFNDTLRKINGDRNRDSIVIAGLRKRLSDYGTLGIEPGETQSDFVDRLRHRLNVVSGLLGEGVELGSEGRSIIRQRDAEVKMLLGLVNADQKACSKIPVYD